MTTEDLGNAYRKRVESYENAINYRTRVINYIALLRLITLVAIVYFMVKGIKSDQLIFYFVSFLMVISFFILVSYYKFHTDKRDQLRQLKKLNITELGCLKYEFDNNPDGSEFIDRHHPWTYDLDIFGKGSLYQFINRTATQKGKTILASSLSSSPDIIEQIFERQEIIKDLKDRIDFRQVYTARANLIEEKETDFSEIQHWLDTQNYIQKNKWLIGVAILSSMASLSIIIAGIIDYSNFRYFLPLLLLNWGILSPFLVRTNKYQSNISKKHDLLSGYASLLQTISDPPFNHSTLLCYQDNAAEGCDEVKKLSGLLNLFDQRLNLFMGTLLNSLFLFDFFMLFFLERWKKKNRDNIEMWIELTGWMEAMISLSGFAYNHPNYTVPEIKINSTEFIAEDMGHPLIDPSKRIANNIQITNEKVLIITGANMAGKSTFLRSIGINTLLGYLGCPVCAQKYSTGLWELYSSMRTSDSLKDEESYFLAEIRRLKEIVDVMEEGTPMLVLLDEVLKGTNTTDKQNGSIGLIEKSLKYNIQCFIATHDLVLGELETKHPQKVVNYCFESHISDNDVNFSYKISRGIAKNMNASFLMKKMGIVD